MRAARNMIVSEGYFCKQDLKPIIATGGGMSLYSVENEKYLPILTSNMVRHVEKIERSHNYNRNEEVLTILFINGNRASLRLDMTNKKPITNTELKEFQAMCTMVHDL